MKKRISALLMALMLAVGMLSGCDNTSINSSDSGKTKVILATDTQTQDDSLNNKTQVVDNDDSANITTKAQKSNKSANSSKNESNKSKATKSSKSTKIPEYNGKAYVELNGNNPEFKSKEITDKSFEKYGSLDNLGRCTVCVASVGKEIMPTEKRGEIGMVKPTGWRTVKYDFVDGKYLYNRCHLIGYQLTGENANEKNLITGTRYLNVTGMLPFEDMVADYVKETSNHVMYRVTPIFEGNNLVAKGVKMEGYSVEDKGEGISFNVFCYNVQPGVTIDYATGDSIGNGKVESSSDSKKSTSIGSSNKNTNGSSSSSSKSNSNSSSSNKNTSSSSATTEYILNMNTHKFHTPSCRSVKQMSNSNKSVYKGTRQDLINQGYDPCKICNP